MNLHEYQAKELLKKYQVPVQEGIAVDTVMAAEEAYRQIKTQTGNNFAVIKAQIHAGGRGKGKIEGTEQRGVAVANGETELLLVLRKYNQVQKQGYLPVAEVPEGALFETDRGKVYQKGPIRRKRYECVELTSGLKYSFSAVMEVRVLN